MMARSRVSSGRSRGRPSTHQKIIEAKEQMKAYNLPYDAFLQYAEQYHNARHRNIDFPLSLKEWWDWWQEDNNWDNRGNKGLHMARLDPFKGYTLENIIAATKSDIAEIEKVWKDIKREHPKEKPLRKRQVRPAGFLNLRKR